MTATRLLFFIAFENEKVNFMTLSLQQWSLGFSDFSKLWSLVLNSKNVKFLLL